RIARWITSETPQAGNIIRSVRRRLRLLRASARSTGAALAVSAVACAVAVPSWTVAASDGVVTPSVGACDAPRFQSDPGENVLFVSASALAFFQNDPSENVLFVSASALAFFFFLPVLLAFDFSLVWMSVSARLLVESPRSGVVSAGPSVGATGSG